MLRGSRTLTTTETDPVRRGRKLDGLSSRRVSVQFVVPLIRVRGLVQSEGKDKIREHLVVAKEVTP